MSTQPHVFPLNDVLDDIIMHDLHNPDIVPGLFGGPGISKSARIKALAAKHDLPIEVLQVNTMQEKGDLTGVRTVEKRDENGQPTGQYHHIYIPNEIVDNINTKARQNPDKIALLVQEEINRTDADVTSAAMTLATERKNGSTPLEPNVRIIVTGNLRGNVTVLDGASKTRFAIYEVTADYPTWKDYMLSTPQGLHPAIANVLDRQPELLVSLPDSNSTVFNSDDDDDDDNKASDAAFFSSSFAFGDAEDELHANPRTITGLNSWLSTASTEFMEKLLITTLGRNEQTNMLAQVVRSHTGDTEFSNQLIVALTHYVSQTGPFATHTKPSASANTTPTMTKPATYDELRTKMQRSDIQTFVQSLDQAQVEELILFLMVDTAPINIQYLRSVIPACLTQALSATAVSTMIPFINHGALNSAAVETISNLNTPLAENITTLVNMLHNNMYS